MPQRPSVSANFAASGSGCRPVRGVDRPGQIAIEMGADGARDVALRVHADRPSPGCDELVPAVEHHEGSRRPACATSEPSCAASMSVVYIPRILGSAPCGYNPCRRHRPRFDDNLSSWPSMSTGEAAAPTRGACCWRSSTSASPYTSHLLQFSKQEHKSPQMLAMNFRGRVPVLKDGDYVVFESLAVLYYLDQKYPDPPLFGRSPEEAGVIMRVICEYQAYAEEHVMKIVNAFFIDARIRCRPDELAQAMHVVASEARSIEGAARQVRLGGRRDASPPPTS